LEKATTKRLERGTISGEPLSVGCHKR